MSQRWSYSPTKGQKSGCPCKKLKEERKTPTSICMQIVISSSPYNNVHLLLRVKCM